MTPRKKKPWRATRVVNLGHRGMDNPGVIRIGRGTSYGNPFTHLPLRTTQAVMEVPTRREALDLYRGWVLGDVVLRDRPPPSELEVRALAGCTLGCYCVGSPTTGAVQVSVCHGQILAELADNLAAGRAMDGSPRR